MPRPLTVEELSLVSALVEPGLQVDPAALVAPMSDGGMGSLRFSGPPDATFGEVLVEAEAKDSDGTPLLISVNLDQYGELFELDIWKVDFSPFKRIPSPSELRITSSGGSL